MMTGAEIQAARKLLKWSPERLASRAHLTLGVVLQAERDGGHALVPVAAARSIQKALEAAGIEHLAPVGPIRLRS